MNKDFIESRPTLEQLLDFIDFNRAGGEKLAIHTDGTDNVDIVETSSKLLKPFYDNKVESIGIYYDEDDCYEIWLLQEGKNDD